MKSWKRLAALALAVLLGASVLSGCGKRAEDDPLPVCVGDTPETLDPIFAEEIGDQTILTHLYENLMKLALDMDGKTTVVNGMAKSVSQETNFDGTVTYTFRLRSAHWSDGKSVRAADFVYAWRRLADPASCSPYAELLSVVQGYDEARKSGDMTLLQVSAKNDSTLVVVLNGNYDWFLTEVCTSPATMPLRQDVMQDLKETAEKKGADAKWWSDPEKLVTNGAYQVTDYVKGKQLDAVQNEHYYGNGTGPKQLSFVFAPSEEIAWSMYESGDVDAVWCVPDAELTERAADAGWSGIPVLSTYAAVLNGNVIRDTVIMQAMTMVIDRNAIAEAIGVTARPAEGLVPYGVPENSESQFRETKKPLLNNDPETYEERCQQALELLAEAGYDNGTGLGELEYLYEENLANAAAAQALCQQWKENLNLNITPRGVTKQELWTALRSGEYSVAALDIEAVGNDAECFLMDWTSKNPDNVAGYSNSAYDTLMAIIATAPDGTARMGCLHDAEELLVTDGAIAPLFTRSTDWELRDNLVGAIRDARGWFSFTGVVEKSV